MPKHKLSARQVTAFKKAGRRLGDGGGLWLQCSAWGTKSWVFQYRSPVVPTRLTKGNEKNPPKEVPNIRMLGLGSVLDTSLAEAREAADAARKQVKAGIDPVETRQSARQTKRLAAAKTLTFRQAASDYIAKHRAGWRNDKHAAQWPATLATYAYPIIGELPVAAIDSKLVTDCLSPIWETKPETARRLRGRIEAVLDYAAAMRARDGDNPARWSIIKHLVSKPAANGVEHHPALPYKDVAAFLTELRTHKGLAAKALDVTILTALRTSEVIGAKWSEIDLTAKLWTIPQTRTKTAKPHEVPLSDPVLAGLRGLPQDTEYVFANGKRALSNMAMLELLREMRPGLTVHGFRSTFRDWAAERAPAFPRAVAERALGHGLKNKTEAAYERTNLLPLRRQLMAEWARYCSAPEPADTAATVVPLGRRGRRRP